MKKLFPFFKHYPQYSYFDSAATTLKPYSVIKSIQKSYEIYALPAEKSFYTPAEVCLENTVNQTKKKLYNLFGALNFEIFFNQSITISLEKIINHIIPLLYNNEKTISILIPETVHNVLFDPLIINDKIQYEITFYNQNNIAEYLLREFCILYIPSIDHISGILYNKKLLINYKKKYPNSIIIIDACQLYPYKNEIIEDSYGDIFLLSSHKMYGPDSIAVIFIKKRILNTIFISEAEAKQYLKKILYAGSFPYSLLAGFLETLFFLEKYIYNNLNYIKMQQNYIESIYTSIINNNNLQIYSPKNTPNIISFYHKTINSQDISAVFNENYIAVRTGNICNDQKLTINGLIRISLGFYTNSEDINKIIKLIKML